MFWEESQDRAVRTGISGNFFPGFWTRFLELFFPIFFGIFIYIFYSCFYGERTRLFESKFFPDFSRLKNSPVFSRSFKNQFCTNLHNPFYYLRTLFLMPSMNLLAERYRQYRAAGYPSKQAHQMAFHDVMEEEVAAQEQYQDPYLSVVYSDEEGI